MNVNVKFKVILRHVYRKRSLFVSLLFVMALVFSGFVLMFSDDGFSFVLGASNKVVSNETDLKNAVNDAFDSTVIALNNDITLTEQLVIPVGKDITLTSIGTKSFKLIGGYTGRTGVGPPYGYNLPDAVILVEGSGVLRLDGIVVTCVYDSVAWNKLVRVAVCGALFLYTGEIFGIGDVGGVVNAGVFTMFGGAISNCGCGVYNSGYGTFSMFGGEIFGNTGVGVYNWQEYNSLTGGSNYGMFNMSGGVIRNNDEGGVQNSGNFSMFGGEISNNVGGDIMKSGGGVSNAGNFSMFGGVISNNQATYGGGVYNYAHNNFSLYEEGVISNNKAEVGGGVYNAGTFSRCGGVISDNTAAQYSDIYSHNGVYVLPDENGVSFNISFIVIAVIVLLVSLFVVFLFYFRRRRISRG